MLAHLVDQFAPLVRGVPYREGLEGEAFPQLVDPLRQIASEANLGLTQVIRLPLSSGSTVIGLIYVFQSGNYYFVEDAPNLLRSFAEPSAPDREARAATDRAHLWGDIEVFGPRRG